MAAIVFRDKSLRSPSSFGHGDWEVDMWTIMSNFSAQKSALGLCCLSVCYCLIFFSGLFPSCLSPLFLHSTVCPFGWEYPLFVPGMVLGKVFPGEVGLLRGSTYHKGYFGSIN